jgi:hypothetical protein
MEEPHQAHPVNGEVICVRALPVHAELALIVVGRLRHHYPRREHDQRLEATSIQRHILHEGLIHHCDDRG